WLASARASSNPPPSRLSAVIFPDHVVRLVAANEYGAAWQLLNPADQHVADLVEYVQCESRSPIPGRLASLRVLHIHSAGVRPAPHSEQRPGVAVTFRIVIADDALPARVAFVHTVHAALAGDRWTWVLPRERFDLYARDVCAAD